MIQWSQRQLSGYLTSKSCVVLITWVSCYPPSFAHTLSSALMSKNEWEWDVNTQDTNTRSLFWLTCSVYMNLIKKRQRAIFLLWNFVQIATHTTRHHTWKLKCWFRTDLWNQKTRLFSTEWFLNVKLYEWFLHLSSLPKKHQKGQTDEELKIFLVPT